MANQRNPKVAPGQSPIYQIRLEGYLEQQWAGWFGGLAITLEDNGDTLLTGPVTDQAALYGLLRKVRDLGLPLLTVTRINPGQTGAADAGAADADAADADAADGSHARSD